MSLLTRIFGPRIVVNKPPECVHEWGKWVIKRQWVNEDYVRYTIAQQRECVRCGQVDVRVQESRDEDS